MLDFLFGVGIGARVFAVLFTAGVAFVALSAVGGEPVFDECFALAVGASQGDCDGHDDSILT